MKSSIFDGPQSLTQAWKIFEKKFHTEETDTQVAQISNDGQITQNQLPQKIQPKSKVKPRVLIQVLQGLDLLQEKGLNSEVTF